MPMTGVAGRLHRSIGSTRFAARSSIRVPIQALGPCTTTASTSASETTGPSRALRMVAPTGSMRSRAAPCAPRHHRARASWNYLVAPEGDDVLVTYDTTRLMRLAGPRRFMVTLGGHDRVDQETVLAEMTYAHPLYTPESVAAQGRVSDLADDRIVFAGAYHGWGFHEDGAASGLRAAEHLGATWPSSNRRREVVPC